MGKIPGDTKADKLTRKLESTRAVDRLLDLLPSNYFTSTSSSTFGIHYQSLSEEFALLSQAANIVILDSSLREVTFRLLYRNFGHLLDFYVKPFDSEAYRDFLIKLVELYFGGSRVDNIVDGAEYFSGVEARAVEYVKLAPQVEIEDYQSALRMPQQLISNSDAGFCALFTLNDNTGITWQDMHARTSITNRDVFIFTIYLILGQESLDVNPFQLVEDVKSFVNIIKPAHTLPEVQVIFSDEDQFTFDDFRTHFKATLKAPEYWSQHIDLVLNPPLEVFEDTDRYNGIEAINSRKDGTWEAFSLLRDHMVEFHTEDMYGAEQWTTASDSYPLIVCKDSCQFYCEEYCEYKACEAFCETALQACYNCQTRCENICQVGCELFTQEVECSVCETVKQKPPVECKECETVGQSIEDDSCWVVKQGGDFELCSISDQGYYPLPEICATENQYGPCNAAAQYSCSYEDQAPSCTTLNQGDCNFVEQKPPAEPPVVDDATICEVQCMSGCETTCQVLCEINCQVGCEVACEINCQECSQTGCQVQVMQPCWVLAQSACYSADEGFDLGKDVAADDWHTATDMAPLLVCRDACQMYCEEKCQGAECQAFCETAMQECYNCQVYCENICQEVDQGVPCVPGCETHEEGVCSSGCESTCQILCEVACMINCETDACQSASCQIECQGDCQMYYEVVEHPPCSVGCQVDCMRSCEVACQINCMVVCQYACEVGCESACLEGCQTSCQGTCQLGCQSQCEAGCEFACEDGCQISCQNACQQQCQEGCETSCQGACEEVSQTICDSSCQMACQQVRQNRPDSCREGCQSVAQEGGCTQTCQRMCQSLLQHGVNCTTTKEIGCVQQCLAACQTECQTTCQNECQLSCQAYCEVLSCEKVCEGSCETACEQLEQDCRVGCMSGCVTNMERTVIASGLYGTGTES